MKTNTQIPSALTAVEKDNNINSLAIAKTSSAVELKNAFIEELKEIYLTQRVFVRSLNKLADKANSEQLADCIYDDVHKTENHIKKLVKLFSLLGVAEEVKKNEVAIAFLQEKEIIQEEDIVDKVRHINILRDIEICAACLKVKSYEIAGFGSLVAFAKTVMEFEIAILLKDILEEKKLSEEAMAKMKEHLIREYTDKYEVNDEHKS